ncbi:hypothetical protein [Caulobacter sp. NIBR1757]|uniref:hypothetical protein n=1 Tax=Caulobacter sp. NIBR1757 TaxID=3016000 RepID=UPI0022EFEE4C|nr:hypothetical protein [Caulobacter sp. NIBR1757]WGM38693.1 hypothetical protein AMEJIAPC_01597 [Caulobacter sp. NIBR1757]
MDKTPSFRRLLLALAAALGVGLTAAPVPALALPDAQIDQQIRPNFGGLITPPLKPRYRPDKWKPGRYKWGRKPYRPGYRPRYDDGYYDDYPRDQMVAVVDCGSGVYIAGASSGDTSGGSYGGSAPPPSGNGGYGNDQGGGYSTPDRGSSYGNSGSSGQDSYGGTPGYSSPTPVSDALRTLADNGVLYIRGAAACTETIVVEHPVIIAGEGPSIFATGAETSTATFAPSAGNACIRIAAGVKGVELRDLTLKTQQGGRMPCVEAWDAEVALVRVNVEYWGDASAVYASGGRVIMRDTVIDAKSWDPAVLIEGGVIDIARTKISGEAAGVDLTPGNGESRLDQVGIVARGGETPGDVGLLVRGLRSGTGAMTIRNVVVCGWTTGLHLERGANVNIARSRLCDAQRGIISTGASLTVTESAIGAREIGVYAGSGRTKVSRSRFYGGARPGYAEPGAVLELEDNWVYSDGDCWRARYDRGLYCISSRNLPGSLRERGWSGGYRRGWESDGYDYGFQRDGTPVPLPPEQPPKVKKGWGKPKASPAY